MRTKGKEIAKTKTRKAPENLDHMGIVRAYTEGTMSIGAIAKEYNTSDHNVTLIVQRHWEALTNMRETRMLTVTKDTKVHHKDTERSLHKLQNTELVNSEFMRMLSDDHVALLSDAEATYAWIYVHTGNALEAMTSAGLDVNLNKDKSRETRLSFDRAVILRSMYLNEKPNVASYITELREKRYVDTDISKVKIQSELIDQLEFLKSTGDPRARRDILRTIELLGKTIGAFTDRIEISEVDPSNALDHLIEMASEATVREIS